MDVNLKQWREELRESEEEEQQEPYAKIPRQQHLFLESFHHHQSQEAAALPLFVPSEPQDNKIITATTTHCSSYSDGSSTPTVISISSPRFPSNFSHYSFLSLSTPPPKQKKRSYLSESYGYYHDFSLWVLVIFISVLWAKSAGLGGYCFSIAQWQELELQALIFRHMIAGAAVPPELLQLVKKSLLTSYSSPYYLHHYSPHLHQAALLQGGYWGKGAIDPEPGRCRRTDGKKWRCSRDVMAGHKYCERHVHRGRNRSRKPVEFPSSASASGGSAGGVGPLNKPSATTFAAGSCGGIPFSLSASGAASSHDVLQLNQGYALDLNIVDEGRVGGGSARAKRVISLSKTRFDSASVLFMTAEEVGKAVEIYLSRHGQQHSAGGDKSRGKVLMHFFDDWPRSLQQSNNAGSNSRGNSSSMSLSMSTPRNQTSDFLKLSTGNGDEVGPRGSNGNKERERARRWIGGGWGGGQVGGPLGEALRSSTTNSSHSPTSVLHQLPRCSASDTSYVSA
ncbi:hypothetical protein Cgig2_017885 [Carnegiea gigantea]|uniref:Growth-regulating factor n=1 Tax=Carnegiea gigantea TaxID=171969 RepID=A0A9Q1QAG0_9CARY|nr:hypothetical protein Cgig2_017885 [Carnegiea gigantea]